MGFTPPVPQNDSDWEIRVAMLLSLGLQVLLIFLGPLRKRSSHPRVRFVVWSCYLLADWVADLGLGLLLNNLGNIGSNNGGSSTNDMGVSPVQHLASAGLKRGPGGGSPSSASAGGSPPIFSFWTPFLLLHLGGPETITAYSLQDNELWLRHLIGLLFELFSALVVFSCSVKHNPMVVATVLIFVVGTIKYAERTFSLYYGSVQGFRNQILDEPNPGPNYAKLMTEFDSKLKAGLLVEIAIADGEAKKAQDALEQDEDVRLVTSNKKTMEEQAYDFFLMFRRLFVNLILSYKERRISQAYFLDHHGVTATTAFQVIEVELNFIYDMVYTKAPVSEARFGFVFRLVSSACLVIATVLFALLDKTSFHPVDRVITYALLLGGLVLDAAAFAMLLTSDWMLVLLDKGRQRDKMKLLLALLDKAARALRRPMRRWSESTSQLNLISYCLDKPKQDPKAPRQCWRGPVVMRTLICIAKKLRVRETLDDIVFIQSKRLSCSSRKSKSNKAGGDVDEQEPVLLKYVFDGLRDAAQYARNSNTKSDYDKKIEQCRYRGEGILKQLRNEIQMQLMKSREVLDVHVDKEELLDGVLLDSIQNREFDESLLMWHIATDLCFHDRPAINDLSSISETLSEYMLYLLVKQPDMLSATAGIGLLRYRDTCAEARRFFHLVAAWEPEQDDARRMLLAVNTSREPKEVKGDRSKSVLFDACILAKVLRQLNNDTMWKVVAGVWMEMLTYAAGKCLGSTHVEQLCRGGELITMVWFLMAHMGIGDMYRIQQGDAKAKLIVHDQ